VSYEVLGLSTPFIRVCWVTQCSNWKCISKFYCGINQESKKITCTNLGNIFKSTLNMW
jgi:hypothetical protein